MNRYTVLGAGSWGTALAMLIAKRGHEVTLWGRCPAQMQTLETMRCNEKYLPGFTFPNNLTATADLQAALAHSQTLLINIPSHTFPALLKEIKENSPKTHDLIWGTKGLAPQGKKFLHELVLETFGDTTQMALLSGPSFAKEVALEQPTALVMASPQEDFLWKIIHDFSSPRFRIYGSHDLIGVQLGGVVKNILAIATGIADGLNLGPNARSALITRGLAEMLRLGHCLGAKQETLMGLSGLGDMILTCTDNQSRNRRFGLAIGAGQSIETAQTQIGQIVEGIYNVEQVLAFAKQYCIEMPITQLVHQVLQSHVKLDQVIDLLMQRGLCYE
jgi:glycerol-3-phosphate dehydrogenase (NAD(P)+)